MDGQMMQSQHIAAQLLDIRAGFATWLTQRQLFSSLTIFAQVQLIHTPNSDTLASINNHKGIHIRVNNDFLQAWHVDRNLVYFVLMHELRHLTQFRSGHDWDHLLCFDKLNRAIEKAVPKSLLQKSGLGDLGENQEFKDKIFNLAADAAIHEDLVNLFDGSIMARMDAFLSQRAIAKGELQPGEEMASITVATLERLTNRRMERGQDWLYYGKQLVEHLSRRIENEPAFAKLILERHLLYHLNQRRFDHCELAEDALAELDLIFAKSEGESLRMLAAHYESIGSEDIPEGLDYQEVYQARKQLNQCIKSLIALIMREITQGRRRAVIEQRSYQRSHRFLAEAPGTLRRSQKEPKSDGVIVFDTSGSMWFPELLTHMAALAWQLIRKRTLKKAYCCDVKLHAIGNVQSGAVTFTGSGCTVWNRAHHDQILADLNTTDRVTIYYCTDEEVIGLDDAIKDERVKLVVINLPKAMTAELKRKARL